MTDPRVEAIGRHQIQPLVAADRFALAAALGDTPATTIGVHLLRRGLCRVVIAGTPAQPVAAVIQADALPSEPTAFGDDPALIWQLLRGLDGWLCLNVARTVGPPIARLIERETGRPCRLYDDIYHVLDRPVALQSHPAVRRLTPADQPLLEAAGAALVVVDWGFGSAATLLAAGLAAGAIVAERLVGIAFTGALSDHHADIAVVTQEPWRGRGLSTAAASLVCAAVQAQGRTPVWSTGQDNAASLRVAAKLGFVETTRRVYVIPE